MGIRRVRGARGAVRRSAAVAALAVLAAVPLLSGCLVFQETVRWSDHEGEYCFSFSDDPTACGGVLRTARFSDPIAFGEGAVFLGSDDAHGLELWRSDGSAEGTRLLADLLPGPAGAFVDPRSQEPLDPQFTIAGGLLYFIAADAEEVQLWRSDGSAEGTVQLTRLRGNQGGSIESLLPWQDGVVMVAEDAESRQGLALWRSDGTPQGTRRITSLAGISPTYPAVSGDRFFVLDWDMRNDRSTLWTLDGAERATELAQWREDGMPSQSFLVPDGSGGIAATSTDPERIDEYGLLLWRSDGTRAGTTQRRLPPLDPTFSLEGIDGTRVLLLAGGWQVPSLWSLDPALGGSPTPVAPGFDRLSARDGALTAFTGDGLAEPLGAPLALLEQRASGSSLLPELLAGLQRDRFDPAQQVGDQTFFTVEGELWRSDGTARGTRRFGTAQLDDATLSGVTEFAVADRWLLVIGRGYSGDPEQGDPDQVEQRAGVWRVDRRSGATTLLQSWQAAGAGTE